MAFYNLTLTYKILTGSLYEGKKEEYNGTEGKKLNPHANTPVAVKMNEINPKYENTRKIHRLLTNQINPRFS
jgi:hypothetical protein